MLIKKNIKLKKTFFFHGLYSEKRHCQWNNSSSITICHRAQEPGKGNAKSAASAWGVDMLQKNGSKLAVHKDHLRLLLSAAVGTAIEKAMKQHGPLLNEFEKSLLVQVVADTVSQQYDISY